MPEMESIVAEYEVFKNDRNALAFFFARQPALDHNPAEGPFWFTVQDNRLSAGTREYHAVFEAVQRDIVDIAQQRGVIMMIEFENQQPVRCTPCYFSDTF